MNEELQNKLDMHKKWLRDEEGCARVAFRGTNFKGENLKGFDFKGADLRGVDLRGTDLRGIDFRWADFRVADLRGANLRGSDLREIDFTGADLRAVDFRDADLRGADIEFSSWPLWCGSLGVKVDKRIAAQLAYHFCRLDCDDSEYLAARNVILNFANIFHRVQECGKLEKIEGG